MIRSKLHRLCLGCVHCDGRLCTDSLVISRLTCSLNGFLFLLKFGDDIGDLPCENLGGVICDWFYMDCYMVNIQFMLGDSEMYKYLPRGILI